MYNKQLETFLKVAAFGSFSAAAEKMYISPSAVIQQMNALEQELGAALFIRNRKGVTLTEAGKYLHGEAADYIAKGSSIKERLAILADGDRPVYIGTNPEYKIRFLYDLWTRYTEAGGRETIALKELKVTDTDSGGFDIVEGVRTVAEWQTGMHFEKLGDEPVVIGMRYNHPLAAKKMLTYDDLKPYTVLASKDSTPPLADSFFAPLREKQIYHELVTIYSPSVIWELSRREQLIILPRCRSEELLDIICRPLEDPFLLEYGIFYHQPFMGPERGFVDFVLQERNKGNIGNI